MRKYNLIIAIGVFCILGLLFAALLAPVHAGLVYDMTGQNALIKGQCDATRYAAREITVDEYTDLVSFGGVSVFMVDLTQYSRVNVDLAAIYDSVLEDIGTGLTPWANAFSGVTVIADDVTENNDRVVWEVACVGVDSSGASPVSVWAPRNSGNTNYAQTLRGIGASSEWITGASVWTIDDLGDRKAFRNAHDSGISIYEIETQIGT